MSAPHLQCAVAEPRPKWQNRFMKNLLFLTLAFCGLLAQPLRAATDPAEPFWFVQITDTHHGKHLHQWRFRQAIKEINALPVPVSCVIHTGDFSSDSLYREEVAATISNLCAQLPQPVLKVPGNHDLTLNKRHGTNRFLEAAEMYRRYLGPFLQVHETDQALFLAICTETLRRKDAPPLPGFDPLKALDERLAQCPPDKPVFVFTHVPDCDDFYLNHYEPAWENEDGRRAWREVLGRYPNVKAVIGGHFHRAVQAEHPDNIPTIVAPCIASFWGRQGSFRLYRYENGCLSYQEVYLVDPPAETAIDADGFIVKPEEPEKPETPAAPAESLRPAA